MTEDVVPFSKEKSSSERLTPFSLSVVVPVYRSAESLPPLLKRLTPVLEGLCTDSGVDYEVILVNDGSPDNSWEVVQELQKSYPHVVGINLMRNYGQHNALLAGTLSANCEVVVTMDDDLQHPPEEIPKLLSELAKGFDIVYGTAEEQTHNFYRNFTSKIYKFALQTAMGVNGIREASAFRVFRTEIREAFRGYSSPFVSLDVLLSWGSAKFSAVMVKHDVRQFGESNYSFRKLLSHAFTMMTGFSPLPLRIASITGFAFTVFGVMILAFVLGVYLFKGSQVPGFAFLASGMAIFAGVQLFALGIIGEYIARIHQRSLDKPSFVIRETTRSESALMTKTG